MKLELKHICGYLPYGLKAITTCVSYKNPSVGIVDYWSIHGNVENEISILADHGYYLCEIKDCKPLLHPMSDLYKEINGVVHIFEVGKHFESTGSLFVEEGVYSFGWNTRVCDDWQGYEIGWRDDENWLGVYYDEYDFENQDENFTADILPFRREVLEYLFEHHFDIYGLIDKGLAIDINTVK